ncbi:Undecaprenyl-diphosphatase [Rosistilla carotiformis]|uniref:Undecaprenyl-diphosphatase n=1 Tax=Rosistilla carotiformis TaxID=2528017 RepID=A0A518K1D3_9BACT|nr:undecaprenyl-diphosphate phosphatase [Rosistilla carotiformis]QDV71614.1 Undecaprenyl-diphosphatase [Rosistilla carotiformis]
MWEMVLLAVVQGIAEFLPISSSGHLVIFGELLGITEESATVNIVLHAGTLASILVVYWRRILDMLTSDRRVIPLLVIGTIPAGITGVIIKTQFKHLLESPLIAGCMLLVTGALLLLLKYLPTRDATYQSLSWRKAFEIGIFQAFALMPGISRSGSTIVGGRMLGLGNEDAVTFSFLLAIPAILGATVLEMKDLAQSDLTMDRLAPLIVGAVVAFLVGIFALRWLIAWSRRGRLHLFAWWCIPMGIGTILWQLR